MKSANQMNNCYSRFFKEINTGNARTLYTYLRDPVLFSGNQTHFQLLKCSVGNLDPTLWGELMVAY